MTAPEIVTYLVENGFTVGLDTSRLSLDVSPDPTNGLLARISAKAGEIVNYFQSLDATPASAHAFVAYPGDAKPDHVRAYCVCIACGIPWGLHGRPPDAFWLMADDPDAIEAVTAAPIQTGAS